MEDLTKSYRLWDHGPWASFVGSPGDYTVRVSVEDMHGAFASLEFPLQCVEPPVTPMYSPQRTCPDVENEPPVPPGLDLP